MNKYTANFHSSLMPCVVVGPMIDEMDMCIISPQTGHDLTRNYPSSPLEWLSEAEHAYRVPTTKNDEDRKWDEAQIIHYFYCIVDRLSPER